MDDHSVLTGLATRAAISDVIVAYATAVDTRDWTSFRQLFTDDAVIDYTASYGIAGGPDEITRWISSLMTLELVPDTMHAITNVRISVDGDTAAAWAYYVNPDVMTVGADEPYLLFNAGRYSIALRQAGGRWRISRLDAEIMFSHRGALEQFSVESPG
jgi:3-phenylpropionate/cinnamic acid dioxygenase small subunit